MPIATFVKRIHLANVLTLRTFCGQPITPDNVSECTKDVAKVTCDHCLAMKSFIENP